MNNLTSYKGDGRFYLKGTSHQPPLRQENTAMSNDKRMAILREMGIVPEAVLLCDVNTEEKIKRLTPSKPLRVKLEV